MPTDHPDGGVWTRRRREQFLEQQAGRERFKRKGRKIKERWTLAKSKARGPDGDPGNVETINFSRQASLALYATSAQELAPLVVRQNIRVTTGNPKSFKDYLVTSHQRGQGSNDEYIFIQGGPLDPQPTGGETEHHLQGAPDINLGENIRAGLPKGPGPRQKLIRQADGLVNQFSKCEKMIYPATRCSTVQALRTVLSVLQVAPALQHKLDLCQVRLNHDSVWSAEVQVFSPLKLLAGQKVGDIWLTNPSSVV